MYIGISFKNEMEVIKINKFIEIDNSTYIVEYVNRKGDVYRATIDANDLENVKNKNWRYHKNSNSFVSGNGSVGNETILLHRFLMNDEISEMVEKTSNKRIVVDHIDGNPLNNTRKNLRVCTQGENVKNKTKFQNNICGVYFDNSRSKWVAEIKINFTKVYLGRYDDYSKAVYVRFLAETLGFKEFRNKTNNSKVYSEIRKVKRKDKLILRKYVLERLFIKEIL